MRLRTSSTLLPSPSKQCSLTSQLTRQMFRLSALILLLFSAGLCDAARAQSFQAGIDFVTLIPRGEFRQNVDNNGYGVGGQFLYRLPRSPFLVGVDAGVANYGTERRDERLSTTIPELELEVRTRNNIGWVHFLIRAQPQSGRVRPYIDGLIGVKRFFTDTTINSEVSEEPLASTTNLSDTTSSYGVGGGVQIHLADISRRGQIVFDTKLRYIRGGEAEYLRKGSITRENGQLFFDSLRSHTDALSLHFGVTFRF